MAKIRVVDFFDTGIIQTRHYTFFSDCPEIIVLKL